MYLKSLIVISTILFSGCTLPVQNSSKVVKQQQEPQWLLDPYTENDKIAAVGCAKIHFKGVTAQKDLAISRAIDRIATQNKVTVENVTMRRKSSSNGSRGSSSSSSSSLHSVDKLSISTKTKAVYTKPNGDICAWVVQR
jgi:hypothetical protein